MTVQAFERQLEEGRQRIMEQRNEELRGRIRARRERYLALTSSCGFTFAAEQEEICGKGGRTCGKPALMC